MNVTPENIIILKSNEVFCFGSNLAGRHGAGAAHQAHIQFKYPIGMSFGLHGKCYAIPTKDKHIQTLPLEKIKLFVDCFIDDTKKYPKLNFLTTMIGCGLAGYQPKDIAPLFKKALYLDNVYLPQEFINILNTK